MTWLRRALLVVLLVAIARGSVYAVVVLFAWQAWQLASVRRELFEQREDDALRRLSEYWQSLTNRQP